MAMEDTERLVEAVMIRGAMYRPSKVDGLVLVGPWTRAEIVAASLFIAHGNGLVLGSVRYRVEGDTSYRQSTFHDLMSEGWTLHPKLWPSAIEREREKDIRAEVQRRLRAAKSGSATKRPSKKARRA